jgi:hypothetical protein
MTHLELFHAFVAPAIFVSGAGLLMLSLNARLIAIVSRLRTFHKDKRQAFAEGKAEEVLILQKRIESIDRRATRIRNALFCTVLSASGILITCLILGLAMYVPEAFIIGVFIFVTSIVLMMIGLIYYLSEIAISLASTRAEEHAYDSLSVLAETPNETHG